MLAHEVLTENDVIDAVRAYLEARSWEIARPVRATDRGPDIAARHPSGEAIVVEAKRPASADPRSARFGSPFDSVKARAHVAGAFCTAAAACVPTTECRSAIALPADDLHRRFLTPVAAALRALSIGVFWVAGTEHVEFEAEWSV